LNPKLLGQKALGRLRRAIVSIPSTPVKKQIGGSVCFEFEFQPYLTLYDFRAMYTDSYDIALVNFMKKYLKKGDVFIDVGANVGYISAIAASLVGKQGEVHSFEPLKECFGRLERLVELNPDHKFVINNFALGEIAGMRQISYPPLGGSGLASLVPRAIKESTAPVEVKRLDRYIFANIKNMNKIKMIKIDVEGYEFPVLRGLSDFLNNTACRPMILCEILPAQLPKLNYTLQQFDHYMRSFSYAAFDITNSFRRIDVTKIREFYPNILFRAEE
jgi:FkbM family methyltransferase